MQNIFVGMHKTLIASDSLSCTIFSEDEDRARVGSFDGRLRVLVLVRGALEEALARLALADGHRDQVGRDVGDEDLVRQRVPLVPVGRVGRHQHLQRHTPYALLSSSRKHYSLFSFCLNES